MKNATAIILAAALLSGCATNTDRADSYCADIGLTLADMPDHFTECPGEHDREFDNL